ncbi:MAG TPA: Asp23/Gls24 family envelope stress response protein [Planctomycetes bacterium]|nr:Asp23/Gls24 family envelope stress response protein [Planctomycetota bacterium]
MPEQKEPRRKGEKDVQRELVISPAIVVDIVRKEALNTAGVVELGTDSFIGRGKGVTVVETTDKDEIAYKIEIHMYVEYGVNCRKLAEVLAGRVSRTVKQMTQRDVLEVAVHVEGIREPVPGEDDEGGGAAVMDF